MGSKEIDTVAPTKVREWTATLAIAVRAAFLRGNSLPLLMRVGVPVGNVDPFAWLSSRHGPDRIIWQARHHNKIRAMFGSAAVIAGDGGFDSTILTSEIDRFLSRPGDEMRFFGGTRFDGSCESDEVWRAFGGYRFVLPRFELHTRGPNAQIYCNLVFPEDSENLDSILKVIARLNQGVEEFEEALSTPVTRNDIPDKNEWVERIQWALGTFSSGQFEKVVLARRTDFKFSAPIDPFLLLKRLVGATPNCFHFYLESDQGAAFVGASPERLFYRNGLQIDSEAVAGTRPRGKTEDVDEEYRASLLSSEKDRREHAYVQDSIESVLRAYCDSVTVDHEASEMRLAQGRHLVSRISGVLSKPVSNFDLLEDLHPTPAVGGYPTDHAVSVIRDVEKFDRGWYAGPVGWVGRDSAEFAVALRCGVVDRERLSLFSGAGIVEGSQPDLEWEEIEQKIVDFINVIGLELRNTE
ncbi:MAG: isochorismate synthase [Bacteroidetes bacterium]|nr:isochorismate synthase [Bacteroidota bacterium]